MSNRTIVKTQRFLRATARRATSIRYLRATHRQRRDPAHDFHPPHAGRRAAAAVPCASPPNGFTRRRRRFFLFNEARQGVLEQLVETLLRGRDSARRGDPSACCALDVVAVALLAESCAIVALRGSPSSCQALMMCAVLSLLLLRVQPLMVAMLILWPL